ncbi:MAG TPA: HIT domain-containing protein [Myxococcota bacterium]
MEPDAPWRCAICGFEQARPIARLRVSTLALYDDARFPGRAVLVLDAHATLVEDLPLETACDLARDVREAALAVRAAAGARRVNYAAFGNVVPHVHVHLVPRHGPWDTAPRASPWDHPEPERPLAPGEADRLFAAIRAALGSG